MQIYAFLNNQFLFSLAEKPGILDMKANAKWNAWSNKKGD